MTLLRLALRLQRTGLIAATAIAGASALVNPLAFTQLAGSSPAERALFAQQMELLGRQLSYFLPVPAQLDTLAGYMQWRHFGFLPLIYAFWALLAAVGAGRGDEDRGVVELWLASGVSRWRWLLVRVGAFAAVAALSVVVTGALAEASAVIANDSLPADGLAGEGLVLLLLTLWCYGLALLVAQLVGTARAANGIGGVALLALYLLNSLVRSGADVGPLGWISPFWLAERSSPLLRGGSVDGAATVVIVAEAVALGALAVLAFARRDLGSALLPRITRDGPPTTKPARDPLLRVPVLALVDQQRVWVAGWTVGLAVLGLFFASMTRTLVDTLMSSGSALRVYFERAGISAYDSFIGVSWFSTALLLLSLFVVAQVATWASDDGEGRLETVLAAPISRSRVVVERLAAVLVAATILVAGSSLAVWLAARGAGIALDGPRFTLASALMLPVAFAFAGLGHAIVGWRPRAAVAVLATVAVVSYYTLTFAPLFGWPQWVKDLSLYALYGAPLTSDVDWARIGALVAIGTVGSTVAVVAMRRRDVGR